ncbi:MAG: beta-lactamase [Parcubacteria group bacterium Athens0416_74]|nr:MAG: beta-lactamase [Parcubacteria group bacterium Athens0416_74]
MREALRARIEAALSARVFRGCAVGVVTRDGAREVVSAGSHTYDANARTVNAATLYDVASITKSIPTASLALVLIEEGTLSLDESIKSSLPELQNDFGATVRDLLTYTVAGPRLSELKELPAEKMLATVFERGFEGPPGESKYTNLPALLLGILLERRMKTTLDILARRYFFDPLKMHDTAFYAGAAFARAAPTELEDWRGMVSGVTHDESAYTLAKAGHVSGHAGLFSTTNDMLIYLHALLEEKDARMGAIVRGAEQGLGWQIGTQAWMGSLASPTTFGKTGFTGTSILVDRERGVAFSILSNRTYPKRPSTDDAIYAFRADIANIILT